jgi:hypothetical protein
LAIKARGGNRGSKGGELKKTRGRRGTKKPEEGKKKEKQRGKA